MKRNVFRWMVSITLILSLVLTSGTAALAASSTMKILKVNTSGARLRGGPGDYEVITTLKKGAKVFYSGKTVKSWSLVCTSDGKIGYVYKGYLSNYGQVLVSQIYYTSDSTKLYKKPSTSASKVTSLDKNEFIIVLKKAGNWGYAKTLSGKTGFVPLGKLEAAA